MIYSITTLQRFWAISSELEVHNSGERLNEDILGKEVLVCKIVEKEFVVVVPVPCEELGHYWERFQYPLRFSYLMKPSVKEFALFLALLFFRVF